MRVRFRLWAWLAIAAGAATAPGAGHAADTAPAFDVKTYDLIADRNVPELCFHFSGPLARQPDTPLENFVAVDPDLKIAAVPRNDRLCLTGFTFGTHYAVTLKPGLPGISGALSKEARFAVAFPDRPPAVAFAAEGDVLPRIGTQILPVRTVNLSEVAVDILHIGDRDVLQQRLHPALSAADLAAFAPTHGERIWQGTLPTKGDTNRDTITDLAVESRIGGLKPGLYVAVVRDPKTETAPGEPLATQYFTVTDLGLTAYLGGDSLVVAVRSLSNAAAAASVDIALIGENNRELARVRTDGSGLARFDPAILHGTGGDQPAAFYAYGAAGEFSVLDLDAAALNLNDRDVSGRPPGGTVEAMLYPERNLYRPGETAQITILVRDDQGHAPPKQPLTVRVTRPDGALYESRVVNDQGQGAYSFPLDLPPAGTRGVWTISAYAAPSDPAIGTVRIEVADLTPPNLAVSLSAESAVIDPTQPGGVAIQGQYAFGGPAISIAGELAVTVATASNPFPAFPGYVFGLAQEQDAPVTLDPVHFVTDAKGASNQPLKLGALPKATKPLEARIKTTLFDPGGQGVDRVVAVPIANQPLLLGVKVAANGSFAEGQTAHFDVIALAPDGARQEKPGAGWEIVREDNDYYWYRQGTRWTYGTALHDTHVAGGMADVTAGQPAAIEANLPPGTYRVEVFDPKGETATSARFRVGWWPGAGNDAAPDSVEIKSPKATFAPGEGADIFVKPPFDAEMTVALADGSVGATFIQHIPAAGGTVHIDMPRDLKGGGLYLLATAFAPPAAQGALPRRAVGVQFLAVDPAPRRLDVKLDIGDKAIPQRTLALPVTVAGAGDEPAFVTVTAVDEDILSTTAFASPDPLEFFLGKSALGVAIHDIYGHTVAPVEKLFDLAAGREADIGVKATPPAPPAGSIVSLYSGIVPLDKTGKATVPLNIPEFDGKLRIMVVAWSASRFGSAEASLAVHYPLAASLNLPSFLGPDDRADLTLALDNVDGPRGEYHVSVSANGAVSTQGATDFTANLAEREQRVQALQILAHGPGRGTVTVSVQGPGEIAYERRFFLPVKPAGLPAVRRTTATIKPAGTLTVDPAVLNGLRPDTASLSLAVGHDSPFDLNGLVRELARAGDGSAEQTVSAATPSIIPAAAIQSLGMAIDRPTADDGLKRAVARLLGIQARDGGFVPEGRSDSDVWLTAYVLDFLSRVKSAGVSVPDDGLARGLQFLARHSDPAIDVAGGTPGADTQASLEATAYAVAVLAKNGRIDLPRLRYFGDRFADQIQSPVAVAWVGAAYAALGETAAAKLLFDRATAMPKPPLASDAFATDIRDQAALAALLGESGPAGAPAAVAMAFSKAGDLASAKRRFSAQEAAWILRAAVTVSPQGDAIALTVGDKAVSTVGNYMMAQLSGDTTPLPPVKNMGTAPLSASITVTGAATAIDPRDGGGFEIQRTLFDRAGKPVDPAAVHQNDLIIVVLTGRYTGQGESRPLVTDMLPAGWKIESASIEKPSDRYPWLKDVGGASHAEALADRYLAVPVTAGDRHDFKLAYVVRATTRGQFVMPGPYVEDTAKPAQSARGPAGRLKVDQPL